MLRPVTAALLLVPLAALAESPAKVGTRTSIGTRDGLTVAVAVNGPSTEPGPLQIACLFEYVPGDITTSPPALPAALNGMLHLDQSLRGLITDLRTSGRLAGHALETMLLTPPPGQVAPERILLIGLGDRRAFTPHLLREVGKVGMREALRLGVRSYAHASDLKDAGVESPTRQVAQAVVAGALDELTTARYLVSRGAARPPTVETLTLLAGPAFFTETVAALRDVLGPQK